MRLRALKYLFVFISPAVVLLSINIAGLWSYFALFFTFLLIPACELLMKSSITNMSNTEEELAKDDRLYDYLLYALVPIQYVILIYFLNRVSEYNLATYERIGMITAFGISCGVLGINAAHELGHRSTWYEKMMSKMLLLTSQYMHFFIEHNRGHHKNVSTDLDPASSKYGENLYSFFIRSIRDSWFSAWHLESEKLNRSGHKFWSLHNEMLRFQFIQAAFLAIIFLFFGWIPMLCYLGSAVIGFLLLETVNYIEHYGLRRKQNNGLYERTLPIHSWNSNHPLGRILLLELSRHSDHHYIANRKYQILRHFDESPQMPTGYPGMMLLSFFPPFWFRVMNSQIEKYRLSLEGNALA